MFFTFLFLFVFCTATYTVGIFLLSIKPTKFYKKFIIFIGIFSPSSFILANVLFRYYPNTFSQIIYTLSSYIGGLFIYWLLASFIIGFFYIISKFKKEFPIKKIAYILYAIFSLIALIGIVQAFFIKTVFYEWNTSVENISIKRIVLVSDTHFGPVTQERFAGRIVQKIIGLNPDVVVIAGDMFDGPDFDKSKLEEEIKTLSQNTPVIFVPGNHETYGDYGEFIKSAERMGMNVLRDNLLSVGGINFLGVDYNQNKNREEIKKLIKTKKQNNQLNIAVLHEPSYQDSFVENDYSMVFYAHTHNGQFWPGNFFARRAYGEYTYGMIQKNNTTFITTKGVGTAGPRFRTFNTPEIVVIDIK